MKWLASTVSGPSSKYGVRWLSRALVAPFWCEMGIAPVAREGRLAEGQPLAGEGTEAGWWALAGGGTRGLSVRFQGALLATCTCAFGVGVRGWGLGVRG